MRTHRILTSTASLFLTLALASCGTQAVPTDATAEKAAEAAASEEEANTSPSDEKADVEAPAAEGEPSEVAVTSEGRAQGPLAVIADDETCSIVITSCETGSEGMTYQLAIDNYQDDALLVQGDFEGKPDAGQASSTGSFSIEVPAGESAVTTALLPFTDELPSAEQLGATTISGEVNAYLADRPQEPLAHYPFQLS